VLNTGFSLAIGTPELIPDPLVDIACYSEPMGLGSVRKIKYGGNQNNPQAI